MEEKKETFHYTYSAKEQEEIKIIRNKYVSPTKEEISMEQLRRLDRSATQGAAVVSMTIGIIGLLIMGAGMCCTMLPEWQPYFIPGIIAGIIGIAAVIAAYPIYVHMVKRKRTKLAPEIMRLSEELLK